MAEYAIGDIQGCYDPFMRLLEAIRFDSQVDTLWFVGDLVNRGPDSLAVMRFIKQLAIKPKITLGNHDLHYLSQLFAPKNSRKISKGDTLHQLLEAPDAEELGHWLRHQSILIYSPLHQLVMCHAGISPLWDLNQAIALAQELELVLQGDDYLSFFEQMHGNTPECWSADLTGIARLRSITNYFTRMRFCTADGGLNLTYKGTIQDAPEDIIPWFHVPHRLEIPVDIIFGHWSALEGHCDVPGLYAIDTGSLWGGKLTALRLSDRERFSV